MYFCMAHGDAARPASGVQGKDKKKHKKKHRKKHRKEADEDPRVEAAKKFLKQQLAATSAGGSDGGNQTQRPAELLPASSAHQLPESQRIAADDYFLKSSEFIAWLNEYRQKLFNGERL